MSHVFVYIYLQYQLPLCLLPVFYVYDNFEVGKAN